MRAVGGCSRPFLVIISNKQPGHVALRGSLTNCSRAASNCHCSVALDMDLDLALALALATARSWSGSRQLWWRSTSLNVHNGIAVICFRAEDLLSPCHFPAEKIGFMFRLPSD